MSKHIYWTALPFAMLMAAGSVQAQTQASVAYSPGAGYDKLSWSAFVTVVAPVPNAQGTVAFETWATDAETFSPNPMWPTGPTGALAARPGTRFQPSLLGLAHLPGGLAARAEAGGVRAPCSQPGDPASGNFPTPASSRPPTNCIAEEVVRNRSSFDYITQNNLNTQAGLVKAFAQTAPNDFPIDAIEVKIDWVPVETLVAWLSANGVNVTAGFVRQNYFITEELGTRYAMTSMHISTKERPDWLWATFEHQMNPGRCDTMGCYDQYGVLPPLQSIAPHAAANSQYPACPKSPQLAAMFKKENLSDLWENYCLKATQIDFLSTQSATKGAPVLDGDSVIERINAAVPIAQSSCITCHAYATFDSADAAISNRRRPPASRTETVRLRLGAYRDCRNSRKLLNSLNC
jgi:hypothetical protein